MPHSKKANSKKSLNSIRDEYNEVMTENAAGIVQKIREDYKLRGEEALYKPNITEVEAKELHSKRREYGSKLKNESGFWSKLVIYGHMEMY